MTCAMVLYFDQPFEHLDASLGLSKSAEVRMRSADPQKDILVLVSRGFENISESDRSRLAELKYRVIDASAALADVKRSYSFANESRIWRGEAFHEMCFLRWLVLEKYFGNTQVLSMDSDVVWRVDPYVFFDAYKGGGSTLCYNAPCFAFINGASWYEIYKAGLQRVAEDPDFGREFSRDHFIGLYHDQALLQYLLQTGELENDLGNFLGHGFRETYFMSPNPLTVMPGRDDPPLTFARDGNTDFIAGRVVPFWHMQTRFSRYLWIAKFLESFVGRDGLRVPYDGSSRSGSDVAALVLNNLHEFIRRGDVALRHKRHLHLHPLATRAGIYQEFFVGDLAAKIFRDGIWWRPGVWSA